MLKNGFQLCSRSPVSLRRTEKRTAQSPGSLRPRWIAILNILLFFMRHDALFLDP
jgi:hypothetical protein